ncbi:MAG: DNA modification methylase [Paludibacteraceae bacterium]|nr:DNA modification methylase [Paludibacteraceae bacterium]
MNIVRTETEIIKVALLHPNEGQIPDVPANPRFITEDEYKALVDSLRADNLTGVLQVKVYQHNNQWIVLDGNMRLKALQELQIDEVQCLIVPEGTDARTLRKIVLDSNSNFGQWDWDMLSDQWDMDELDAAGIDIPDLGGAKPTNTEAEDVEEDDFDETTNEIKTRCQAGDIWQLGEHKLLCGDSTKEADIARLMGNEKADLWITDPPYNVNYEGGTDEKLKIANDNMNSGDFFEFLKAAFTTAVKVLKEGCSFYMWYASREHVNFETALNAAGLTVREQLIWNKSSLVLGRFDYHFKHEPCLYGWKDGASHNWYNDRSQTTVMDFEKPRKNDLHPTMKPVPLFAYQIANSSKKGDIVLDTFGGSGTTIIACENLGRKARSVELDPHYCDVILARWEKLTGKEAIKIQ